MTTTIDDNSLVTNPTTVTNSDSPYTTSGEQYIYADTSTGAITVTLSTADTDGGKEIRILDTGGSASTNNITVDTEGSETINPGSKSSITLSTDGTYVDLFSDGSNWFSDRADDKQSVTTEESDVTNETFIRAIRSSNGSSQTSGSLVNAFDGESKDNRGEFSSAVFTPDKDGEYVIIIQADIRGSTVEGDELRGRVRDTTNSKNVGEIKKEKAADTDSNYQASWVVNLTAGNNYKIQVGNVDSSFAIDTLATVGTIRRSVVQ